MPDACVRESLLQNRVGNKTRCNVCARRCVIPVGGRSIRSMTMSKNRSAVSTMPIPIRLPTPLCCTTCAQRTGDVWPVEHRGAGNAPRYLLSEFRAPYQSARPERRCSRPAGGLDHPGCFSRDLGAVAGNVASCVSASRKRLNASAAAESRLPWRCTMYQ